MTDSESGISNRQSSNRQHLGKRIPLNHIDNGTTSGHLRHPNATQDGRIRIDTPNSSGGRDWTVDDSIDLYAVQRWSGGYFGVDRSGNVTVEAPTSNGTLSVAMMDIVQGMEERGLGLPAMIRIHNLLEHRVQRLYQAFHQAIQQCNYQGTFQGVFPLKVNQQSHVVDQMILCADPVGHGLEVGSKAELLIAMSHTTDRRRMIICNGAKDCEFVDLALQCVPLDIPCFLVVENLNELDLILERADHWRVEPLLGIRVKLVTKVEGHWENDSGDRSLFGMTVAQVIEAVDRLKEAGKLSTLQLLHFHLGSQIPNIRNIRDGVTEAARCFVDLYREGVPLKYLDLGGGLAVDYTGSGNTDSHSRNYGLSEYCVDIIEAISNVLTPENVPHPIIVTESGRWTVAPMSVLVFDVTHVDRFRPSSNTASDRLAIFKERAASLQSISEPLIGLIDTLENLHVRRLQEIYNDVLYYRDEVRRQFRLGAMGLRERSIAEEISVELLQEIVENLDTLDPIPTELKQLKDQIADIYYGNFSIFQSLPDAWAIDQVFPVIPIHRLAECPDRRGIVADLTCDCDGRLDRFAGGATTQRSLPLHSVGDKQRYTLGVFLVGAYQETLGDLHNLFGDNNVATVNITAEGEIEYMHELQGDRIRDVLSYLEYQPQQLFNRFRHIAEKAVRRRSISASERSQIMTLFSDCLDGLTYLKTACNNRV